MQPGESGERLQSNRARLCRKREAGGREAGEGCVKKERRGEREWTGKRRESREEEGEETRLCTQIDLEAGGGSESESRHSVHKPLLHEKKVTGSLRGLP